MIFEDGFFQNQIFISPPILACNVPCHHSHWCSPTSTRWSVDHMLLCVGLTHQRVDLIHRTTSSHGSPPPRPPPKLLFSTYFCVFCVFSLFLLFFVFSVSLETRLDISCYPLIYLSFFESQIRYKFIGVFVLPMVLSIIMGYSCQKLHSQVTFTFLDLH
jgi:hypothetical protein